jgi:flavodoxin
MKTLVVYYTRTGNTTNIAGEIAAALEADVEELKDDVSRGGPVGFVRSGREAKSGKLVDLDPLSHEPSKYDLVVIGTPVWAQTMSSPIRTFLRNVDLGNARVAWFCTVGAQGQSFKESCFNAMADESGCIPLAIVGFSAKDIRSNHSQAITDFASTLKAAMGRVRNGVA